MLDEAAKETAERIAEKLPLQGVTVVVTKARMEGEEPPTLEQVVDADIDGFKKYFCDKLGNDSLSHAERAIIKTYLWYKTHEQVPSTLDAEASRHESDEL